MTLFDKYRNVEPGQWVKFKTRKGMAHYLLVADKKGDVLTIEEKITNRGFLTSWTQLDIDLDQKKVIAVREKDPAEDKIIEQRRFDNSEIEKILKIRFNKTSEKPVTKRVAAGKFKCHRYTGVYDEGQIVIYYSDKIPLYPVRIAIHRYDKQVDLRDFGQGHVSEFYPDVDRTKPDQTEDKNDTQQPAGARTCGG